METYQKNTKAVGREDALERNKAYSDLNLIKKRILAGDTFARDLYRADPSLSR